MWTLILVSVLVILFTYLVIRSRRNLQFWEKRGIKHIKPLLFLGNSLPTLINQKNLYEIIADLCNEYPDDPILGVYVFGEPFAVIQDLDYIDNILTKDFTSFMDRGFEQVIDNKDPFQEQLFFMSGKKWRAFRYKLSPTFTSGKLKSMFLSMADCGQNLVSYLDKIDLNRVDVKEAAALLFTDIAGSAVFGIDSKTLQNPNSEFRQMGKKLFSFGIIDNIKSFIIITLPWLAKKLQISFFKGGVLKYFSKVVGETMEYRRKTGMQRNDFIQLMLQLLDQGKVDVQTWDRSDDYLKFDAPHVSDSFEITDEILMAQGATFLIAGSDMLSLALMFTLYELACHPEAQEKARNEVKSMVKQHSGLTHDAVKNMTYIENVLKESQRLFPTALQLIRVCTKEYTFPNGYVMKKGERVLIPISVIHKNPAFYPEPESFKPERFDDPIRQSAYLPFGDGPRMCIAMRFAMLELKFGLATILMHYKVTLHPDTKLPIRIKPSAGLFIPRNELIFKLEKIE